MSIIKKVGLWVVRPSIFNLTPGASNPFYDAQQVFKKIKKNNSLTPLELKNSTVNIKHELMAKHFSLIPIKDRKDSAHVQYAIATLFLMVYLISVTVFFRLNDSMVSYIDTPVLNLIHNQFSLVYYLIAMFYSFAVISQVISSFWRADMLKKPLKSVPFPVFFSTPSLWFKSLRGGSE
jgi:hypothetical protein